MHTWQKTKHIHKSQLVFSSDRMLHKDYDRKRSFKKISGRESQGVWCQEKLIGSKAPVVK
jgi:hypothetical protein